MERGGTERHLEDVLALELALVGPARDALLQGVLELGLLERLLGSLKGRGALCGCVNCVVVRLAIRLRVEKLNI
jgi:hypothetical protein